MKITRRQLRRIIREAIDPSEMDEPLGGLVGDALTNDPDYGDYVPKKPPASGLGAVTPEAWADHHDLQLDFDNEDQKIIYLSTEQANRLDMPAGVNWTATPGGGGWIIYTGEYR